jgi:N-acetylglucosamine kinase-like BadF-type ATPase
MHRLYLGIDGGQSSTKALIADTRGRIIGHGVGGPCNHVSGSERRERFFAAMTSCVNQACEEAGLDAPSIEFAAACLGFSGGPEDKETYVRELIRSRKYKITHDAEIALSGATEGQPGIIVVAGTGSVAFGRNAAGKTARAGGWGYIFGDEGSAFDLVRQALRAALKYEEGWGPETVLRERLLSATGARDANDLLHRFYTDEFPRERVAGFARLVTEAAAGGDRGAKNVLRFAAVQLASLARGAHECLFVKFEPVAVCYIGGVFRSDPVRVNFAVEVHRSIGCSVVPPRYSPSAGAVLEALRLDGNESTLSNVPESEE